MDLWERSEPLDLLDGLLHDSAGGGRVAVITGEAGIGKSTLVSEFAQRCVARADGSTHPYHLMVRGEWAEAARQWSRRGNEFARAQALAGGDEAAASTALRVFDDLGATQAAKHLRAELKKKGFIRVPRGPRPATAAHIAGLTPRQADVLALLAEGLSNVEIAQRLSLSARTVEHHISALLGKLGVSSRGQAAAQVRRFPPIAGPQ